MKSAVEKFKITLEKAFITKKINHDSWIINKYSHQLLIRESWIESPKVLAEVMWFAHALAWRIGDPEVREPCGHGVVYAARDAPVPRVGADLADVAGEGEVRGRLLWLVVLELGPEPGWQFNRKKWLEFWLYIWHEKRLEIPFPCLNSGLGKILQKVSEIRYKIYAP